MGKFFEHLWALRDAALNTAFETPQTPEPSDSASPEPSVRRPSSLSSCSSPASSSSSSSGLSRRQRALAREEANFARIASSRETNAIRRAAPETTEEGYPKLDSKLEMFLQGQLVRACVSEEKHRIMALLVDLRARRDAYSSLFRYRATANALIKELLWGHTENSYLFAYVRRFLADGEEFISLHDVENIMEPIFRDCELFDRLRKKWESEDSRCKDAQSALLKENHWAAVTAAAAASSSSSGTQTAQKYSFVSNDAAAASPSPSSSGTEKCYVLLDAAGTTSYLLTGPQRKTDTAPGLSASHGDSSKGVGVAEAAAALTDDVSSNIASTSTGTQHCEDDPVAKELELWKAEYMQLRLFIRDFCDSLVAKGIRARVNYDDSPLPGFKHRRLLNVTGIEMATTNPHQNVGDDDVPKVEHVEDGGGGAERAIKDETNETSKDEFAVIANDPRALEMLRDVVIADLARHGITVGTKTNNNEVIVRLARLNNGSVQDCSYFNRLERLAWEKNSSFGKALRGKWAGVQQVLAGKAAWFSDEESDPFTILRPCFNIAQIVTTESSTTAIFPVPIAGDVLRDVTQVLFSTGIYTIYDQDHLTLTFRDVACMTSGIDCLGIAVRCALVYKNALLKVDRALRKAYRGILFGTTSRPYPYSSRSASTTAAKQQQQDGNDDDDDEEQQFYKALRLAISSHRGVVKTRKEAIETLLATYAAEQGNYLHPPSTTIGPQQQQQQQQQQPYKSDIAQKDLLTTSLSLALAAHRAELLHRPVTTATSQIPPHPRSSAGAHSSRAERYLRDRIETCEAAIEDLVQDDAAQAAVTTWEWHARHELQMRVQLSNDEADRTRASAYRQVHAAALRGTAADQAQKRREHRLEVRELREQMCAVVAAHDADLEVMGDMRREMEDLKVVLGHAREGEWYVPAAAKGDGGGDGEGSSSSSSSNAGAYKNTAVRIWETFPDGTSMVSGVDSHSFSSALCKLLENRLLKDERKQQQQQQQQQFQAPEEQQSSFKGKGVAATEACPETTTVTPPPDLMTEDEFMAQMLREDILSRRDATVLLLRRTREAAALRVMLQTDRQTDVPWDAELLQTVEELRALGLVGRGDGGRGGQTVGGGVGAVRKHKRKRKQQQVADLRAIAAETEQLLAQERERAAQLEDELERQGRVCNALRVQLADQIQVSEIQRGERESAARPFGQGSRVNSLRSSVGGRNSVGSMWYDYDDGGYGGGGYGGGGYGGGGYGGGGYGGGGYGGGAYGVGTYEDGVEPGVFEDCGTGEDGRESVTSDSATQDCESEFMVESELSGLSEPEPSEADDDDDDDDDDVDNVDDAASSGSSSSSFIEVGEDEGDADSQSGESSGFEDLDGAESVYSLDSELKSGDDSD